MWPSLDLVRLSIAIPPIVALSALVGGASLAAPAGASAASRSCTMPIGASLSSADPTSFRDGPQAILAARSGARLTDLKVTLRRGDRIYASGALPGRLGGARTAVPLTLSGARTVGKGDYELRVSGRRAGCDSGVRSRRTVGFTAPTLPVRAAPVSTLVGDNQGAVRLVLRSVARSSLAGVQVSLVAKDGSTVATTAVPAFVGESIADLPLARPLPTGSYTLRMTGRQTGSREQQATAQPLAFSGGGTGAPVNLPGSGQTVQHAVVDWTRGAWQGREVAGFVAPGIGHGEIVCRPDAQWVRFFPNDPGREVSMMNWTYRDWGAGGEKALREALHTRYTGPDFQEGLNKFWPTEKSSTGQFDGLITDRGVIGAAGGAAGLSAPTMLHLTWTWSMSPTGQESCHVDATFTTPTSGTVAPLSRAGQVLWRGGDNADGRDSASFDVPGLGNVTIACPAAVGARRTVTIDTPAGAAITTRQGSDDATAPQSIGPVVAELPGNGMLSIAFDGGQTMLVSSRWKVNDPDASQNFCAIAAQVLAPA